MSSLAEKRYLALSANTEDICANLGKRAGKFHWNAPLPPAAFAVQRVEQMN
jgi:hypothetical protein